MWTLIWIQVVPVQLCQRGRSWSAQDQLTRRQGPLLAHAHRYGQQGELLMHCQQHARLKCQQWRNSQATSATGHVGWLSTVAPRPSTWALHAAAGCSPPHRAGGISVLVGCSFKRPHRWISPVERSCKAYSKTRNTPTIKPQQCSAKLNYVAQCQLLNAQSTCPIKGGGHPTKSHANVRIQRAWQTADCQCGPRGRQVNCAFAQ